MMTMTRTAGLLLALLALPPGAQAQTVQKCIARDGHARYQSAPCARGERVAEVWDATPEPEPVTVRGPVARRMRADGDAGRRRRGRTRWPDARFVEAEDGCTRARAYRDAAERRAGLARNYDLLSALDRRVFDACR